MRYLIALVATVAALQADTNITVTVTTAQEKLLARTVKRMNAERITNLIRQFPNATFTTNAVTGNVAARVDGQVVGTSGVVTVAGYALDLCEAAIRGQVRLVQNKRAADVAEAAKAADEATLQAVETTLNVKGE